MIKNISDFNKFDNVIITNDNIEKIRKKLDIKEYIPFTGIFNECVFVFKEGYSNHYIYYSQVSKKISHLESYSYEKGKLIFECSFDLDFNINGSFLSDRIVNIKKGLRFIKISKEQLQSYINYISCRYAGVIGYFYLIEKNRKNISLDTTIIPIQNNNHNIQEQSEQKIQYYKNVIKFEDIDITIKTANPTLLDIFKKKYNKHTESWGVRGHYRTLKSGKKVFVKAYTKGNKINYKSKDYKLS